MCECSYVNVVEFDGQCFLAYQNEQSSSCESSSLPEERDSTVQRGSYGSSNPMMTGHGHRDHDSKCIYNGSNGHFFVIALLTKYVLLTVYICTFVFINIITNCTVLSKSYNI